MSDVSCMDKKIVFYGTSLNQCSLEESEDDVGPIQRRRARLNNLQSARDDQGRRRFHGAFTGGFSAGYFNTVDSIEGFQPKSFVSRRGNNASQSKFSHKPEDYMDEEDFGEFGIAPKKIRLASGYTSEKDALLNHAISSRDAPGLPDLLRPATSSIGVKILNRMCVRGGRIENKISPSIDYHLVNEKYDYHGLGYTPLKPGTKEREKQSTLAKPLEAVLGGGQKLRISGTAFGSGLDDGDDLCDEDFAYNYDDTSNYDFNPRTRQKHEDCQSSTSKMHCQDDSYALAKFILCRDMNESDLFEAQDVKYPLPEIDKDWQMPCKMIDLLKTISIDSRLEKGLNVKDPYITNSSQLLSNKFTSSSSQHEASLLATTETLGKKSGLLLYNDLKAEKSVRNPTDVKIHAPASVIEPTISRKEFEWRPCSLLCRHFNVPNPFPDNAFFGTKHVDFSCDTDKCSDNIGVDSDDKSLESLRQSIFSAFDIDNDVASSLDRSGPDAFNYIIEDDEHEDDKPQVVMLDADDSSEDRFGPSERFDDDPDIEVLGEPVKQEPEVITLISSDASTSSSSPRESDRRRSEDSRRRRSQPRRDTERDNSNNSSKITRRADQDNDDDIEDAYGPPLPPSLRALHDTADVGYRGTRSASGSSSSSSNRHRHRRHKDRKSKRASNKR